MPIYLDRITRTVSDVLRRAQRSAGLAIFLELLRRADKDTTNGSLGTCQIGRDELARACNSTSQTVRTILNALETNQLITSTSTNKGTHIRINEFERYIYLKDKNNQQIRQSPTSNQPATNHQAQGNQPLIRKNRIEKRDIGQKSPRGFSQAEEQRGKFHGR